VSHRLHLQSCTAFSTRSSPVSRCFSAACCTAKTSLWGMHSLGCRSRPARTPPAVAQSGSRCRRGGRCRRRCTVRPGKERVVLVSALRVRALCHKRHYIRIWYVHVRSAHADSRGRALTCTRVRAHARARTHTHTHTHTHACACACTRAVGMNHTQVGLVGWRHSWWMRRSFWTLRNGDHGVCGVTDNITLCTHTSKLPHARARVAGAGTL
jgi:hypothetical protein